MSTTALPAEIWGQIFTYVDSFTLWTSCRNVSRLLRHEVEGEMARARLPELEIQWTCDNLTDRYEEVPVLKTSDFRYFSEDRSRAHFSLWTGYRDLDATESPSPEIKGFDNVPWDTAHIDMILTEAIRFSDLELRDRCFGRLPWRTLMIKFDRYINDPDIPGLHVSSDWTELSFEWKELLARFYLDEQYVCSLKRKISPEQTIPPYAERASNSLETPELRDAWCCRAQWERQFEKEDAPQYKKAMLRRVARSHERVGKKFNSNEFTREAQHKLESQLNDLRYYRNEEVMRQLLADRPIEFLQMREIC